MNKKDRNYRNDKTDRNIGKKLQKGVLKNHKNFMKQKTKKRTGKTRHFKTCDTRRNYKT